MWRVWQNRGVEDDALISWWCHIYWKRKDWKETCFFAEFFGGGIRINSVLDILGFRYSKVLRYISMKIMTNDNEDEDKNNFIYIHSIIYLFKHYVLDTVLGVLFI